MTDVRALLGLFTIALALIYLAIASLLHCSPQTIWVPISVGVAAYIVVALILTLIFHVSGD